MGTIAYEAVEVTADGQAFTGKGTFYGCSIFAGTAKIYDNTAASGKAIMETSLPGLMLAGGGVAVQNGIYVDLTTGPVVVYFTRQS